ncbi:MAG: M56 family metallopeptidase [Eubacteriales bacterium]|nr:M56 family metallopeptidase [Eubacteriales bacterium]
MQDFIKCLLSLTVGGSVLAAALLLLGRIKKLPRSFLYWAWVLVLLRLALPMPGALTLKAPQLPAALVNTQPAPRVLLPADVTWEDALFQAPAPAETTPVRPYLDVQERPDPPQPYVMNPRTVSGWDGLFALWLLGFAGCLGWELAGYFRFRRHVMKAAIPPDSSDLALYAPLAGKRGPRLMRCAAVDSPMLLGVLRPVLVLPDRAYSPEILQCVFRHELTHYRRGDIWLKWLAMPILAAHWFNPLTVLIRRAFHQSCELSCDERILKTMDHHQRKCYGETLLVLAARGDPGRTALSTSFCAEKRNLKERLVHIMNFGPKSKWILAITALLVVAVTAACLALGPAREKALEEPQETHAAEAVQGDNSYLSLGWKEVPQAYTGEPLHVIPELKASKDNWGDGIGLLLLLNGRPQPYKTAEDATLRYMHTFSKPLKGSCQPELIIEPVAGHEGETVTLSAFTVKNPRRYTFDASVPFDHADGALAATAKLELQAEPALPRSPDTPSMGEIAEIDFQKRTGDSYGFTFTPGVRLGDTQKFQASASGPAGAELCYVIYFNNEPVFCHPFFVTEGRQQTTIDTNLNFRNFQGEGMVYAVLSGKKPNDPGASFIDISDTYYLTVPKVDRVVQGADVQTNKTVAVVSNVDEFLAAIGPDTIIAMKAGVYDLTTASDYGQSGGPSPYYLWNPVSDGYGLSIYNVDNLFITSERTDSCEIITQSKRAPVLDFVKCNTIDLNCINAGFGDQAAGATAPVLRANGCKDFFVRDCEFYGGSRALQLKDCETLTVCNSRLRDCSDGAAILTSCVDTFLYSSPVAGIGAPAKADSNEVPRALYEVYTSSSCAVLDCHMTDSIAKSLLLTDESQQIYFMGNTESGLDIRDGVFASCNGAPIVDGCQLQYGENTVWMNEEYGGIDYVYSIQGDKLYSEDLDEMDYRSWPLPLSFMKPEYVDYYQENQTEWDRLKAIREMLRQ